MDKKVYKLFRELNIEYEKIEHKPLFTCNDIEKYNLNFDGVICKNLFIRNQNKSHYYLISIPMNKKIDLKVLQENLGETRLSFGNELVLEEKLKIKSGAVSILNLINVEKTDIIFIIDQDILKYNKIGFHPNINTVTLLFSPNNIQKLLDYYNVKYKFIEL